MELPLSVLSQTATALDHEEISYVLARPCIKESQIPPTAVGGYFSSFLESIASLPPKTTNGSWWMFQILSFMADLNDPPTTVGGFRTEPGGTLCRNNLKHPPTAVGGIHDSLCKSIWTNNVEDLLQKALKDVQDNPET